MTYQRGDIILADLPFSDRSGSKVRPALVVQSNRNNARLDDVILALITSLTKRASREPTQLLVEVSTPEGQLSGLLHDSAVKCEHLITLHRSFYSTHDRAFAGLAYERDINECLKAALELS